MKEIAKKYNLNIQPKINDNITEIAFDIERCINKNPHRITNML